MNKARREELFILFYTSHFQQPKVLWGYVTMLWKSPSSWRRFARNFFSFISFARSNKRLQDK
jgi:anaerobic magnesium-protoporphyrin IX monomethyl ester cyclase